MKWHFCLNLYRITMKIFPNIEEIGFIQKSHGFDGLIKLQLNVELLGKAFPKFIWVKQYGKPVPFLVLNYNIIDNTTVIVKIEDINDETKANQLKNEVFYCEEENYNDYFIPLDSYEYLLGIIVNDKEIGKLGEIINVLENENSHATLVVDYKTKEIMIPFVDEFILEINEELGTMEVNLPNGLIDLFID